MRITENGLRKIIREVIKESFETNNFEIQDHIIDLLEDHDCIISENGIVDVKRCEDDPTCGDDDVYILVKLEDDMGVIVYDNIKEEDFQMIHAGPRSYNDMRDKFDDITTPKGE
jgi:hypothetical protein